MYDQDTELRIEELRNKIQSGNKLTLEEAKEAVQLTRAARLTAVTKSARPARGTKASAPKPDADKLLGELDNLGP